jgi:hypothetical protein
VVRQAAALAAMVALVALAAGSSSAGPQASCLAARVNYTPYGGSGTGLDHLPWVGGAPGRYRLRGLLWYWPESWRKQQVQRARIYVGGEVPQGWTTKILWAFLGEPAKRQAAGDLVVRGRRLDGRGSFTQRFVPIGYEGQNGAPSYASIIDVPKPGCWRLQLTTGRVRVSVVFRAVRG